MKNLFEKDRNSTFYGHVRTWLFMILLSTSACFQAHAKGPKQTQIAPTYILSGTISDTKGMSIPGVTVIIEGTSTGTISDADGKFNIDVEENAILVFSSLGFKSIKVTVSNQSSLDIVMEEEATKLNDVLVTAYGVSNEQDFTGSAKTVKNEQLTKGSSVSFESTLKGHVTGVNSFTSGQPGGKSNIRIRGIGSINGNREPLYVIDGIVMNTDLTLRAGDNEQGAIAYNPLSTINSNDIERITVLKDAAAASLYGSRAANGVVLITTKKGGQEKTEIVLDVQTGFLQNLTQENMVNNQEFKELWLEGQLHQYIQNNENSEFTRVYEDQALLSSYQATAQQDYESIYGQTDANADWLDAIYRTGSIQNYNLSASGTEGNTSFFVSGNYFNQEGTIIESDFKKYAGRINLENKSRDWLTVGTKLSIANATRNAALYDGTYAGGLNPLYMARVLPPAAAIYDEDGYEGYADLPNLIEKNAHPIGLIDVGVYENTEFRVRGNTYIKIDFTEGLSFQTTLGVDHQTVDETLYDNKVFGAGGGQWNGVLNRVKSETSQYTTSNVLDYHTLIDEKHKIDVLGGVELQEAKMTSINNYGYDVLDSDLLSSSSIGTLWSWSGQSENSSLLSYFTRARYGFDNRYHFSASYRRDGSSRFGEDARWGDFWSVSGGWVVSNESFFKVDAIDYFKFRGSYGTNGNLPTQNYAALAFFDSDGKAYGGTSGLSYGQLRNENLSWEFSKNFNVGLDLTLFSNIDLKVEYFSKVTEDLLMNIPVSGTTGFTDQLQNFGGMKNYGWEVGIYASPIQTTDFAWNTNLNLTFLQNEVTKLKSDLISSYDASNGQNPIILKEGESLNSFYLRDYAGVDSSNGLAQYYVLEDGVRNGNITTDATKAGFGVFGNAIPDVQGGLYNQLTYKKFDLSFLFTFGLGAEAYDRTAFKRDDDGHFSQFTNTTAQLNPWNPNNTDSDVPIRINGNSTFSNDVSTRHLYSADYLKLRNIKLSYSLPAIAKVIQGGTVYIQGENLFLLTEIDDFDPEAVSNGVSFFQVPSVTSLVVGLQIKL